MTEDITVKPDQLHQLDANVLKLTIKFPREWYDLQQLATVPWDQLKRFTSLHSLTLQPDKWSASLALTQLPAEVFTLPKLQSLAIKGSKCNLKQVSHELSNLTALTSLSLTQCKQLPCLPEEIGSLKDLQQLRLTGCGSLHVLPHEVASLTALTHVDVSYCDRLQELPPEVSAFTELRQLDAVFCWQWRYIPKELCSLPNLEILELGRCHNLCKLPAEISGLSALKYLGLGFCEGLSELPVQCCELHNLLELDLSSNRFVSLPDSFGNLTKLSALNMKSSLSLAVLPESFGDLKGLVYLNMEGCTGLTELPVHCCRLGNLQVLELNNNVFKGLPEACGSMTALTSLQLGGCLSLAALPKSFGDLRKLVCLGVSYCTSLTWEGLPLSCAQLTALRELSFRDCPAFEHLLLDLADPLPCVRALLLAAVRMVMHTCHAKWCLWPLYVKLAGPAHLTSTQDLGYRVMCLALRPVQKRKLEHRRLVRQAAATKLATQQDTMLTTLERMSWLVVLLATATFIAYLQPPGGFGDDKQVLATNTTACSGLGTVDGRASTAQLQQCAMLLFFVFDGMSFGLSVGCLVTIIMLSMPRIQWKEVDAEAGRFYLLLFATWSLLFLAVLTGFAAFLASGLAVHRQFGLVFGPVVPGMVLLLVGGGFFLWQFWRLFPGWKAIRAACSCRCKEIQPVEDLADVEMGRNQFWREWREHLPFQQQPQQQQRLVCTSRTYLSAQKGDGDTESHPLLPFAAQQQPGEQQQQRPPPLSGSSSSSSS